MLSRKLNRVINGKREEIIEFLRDLIRTPSVNPPGDESMVAGLIIDKLKSHGVSDVRVVEKKKGRSNVLARIQGVNEHPTIILCGHIDTKPADGDGWRYDPFSAEIVNGRVYGVGSSDMKGGVASIVMSVLSLLEAETDLYGSVNLVLTADEEAAAGYGIDWLVEQKLIFGETGIVAEPSGLKKSFDHLYIAIRGSILFDLIVYGDQVHSSISDISGAVNASLMLSKLLLRMRDEFKPSFKPHPLYPQGPTLNLGDFIKGGVYYGMTPDKCVAGNDLRLTPGMRVEDVKREIIEFVEGIKKEDKKMRVEVKFIASVEPAEISPEEPIVKSALNAAEEVLGFKPTLGGIPGSGDASLIINRVGIPVIPAFGPGLLPLAHKPNEYVEIEDVINGVKIFSSTILNYFSLMEKYRG